MSCLYILEINPLLAASFADISPHSMGCLFILSTASFPVQKLLHLIRSHLFIFGFIFITLGDRAKKILRCFMSKNILPMFSSRKFLVSSLTLDLYFVLSSFLCMVLEDILISFFST